MIDLVLIDQCKNLNVSSVLVKEIIKVESAFNPLIINVSGKGALNFKNKDEAILKASEEIKAGESVDIGLMQINSKNLESKFFSNYKVSDLFDPCKNIKIGSDIFYLAFKSTNSKLNYNERINKALSIYNTGTTHLGFKNGYVAKYNNFKKKDLRQLALSANTKVSLNYNFLNLKNFNLNIKKKENK